MCDDFDFGQCDDCGNGYFNEAAFQTMYDSKLLREIYETEPARQS